MEEEGPVIRSKPKTVRKPDAHTLLEEHMKELGLGFVPEYRFHSKRKWRFDYLVWIHMDNDSAPAFANIGRPKVVAIEIEGGIWARGRHTRGAGYQADLEKYREATRMGFSVYRFSTQEVVNGTAREFLAELERE